jgi:hypothetical protein
MKKLILVLALLIVGMFVIGLWFNDQTPATGKSELVAQPSRVQPQDNIHVHEYAAKGRVPAFYTTAPDPAVLPPTLAPELFTGNEKLAYMAANEIPETLAQLPCYCHCDRSQNHRSLHSCFESEHGEICGICINEALMAHNLQKQVWP